MLSEDDDVADLYGFDYIKIEKASWLSFSYYLAMT
jgi:hypothetical protein